MEIHHILNSNEAILAPDGKVFTFKSDINDTAGQKLICTICNLKFSTKKTLTHHIKYKHNDTRLVYVCPECKDDFANAWCVFRHLYKVHRKTSTQIRRMRDHIHLNRIVKKQEPIKKKSNVTLEIEYDHELDFPHDNSQYCEACGKRFDRKAALHSHVQMCMKKLALATIKENHKNMQDEKVAKQKIVKGSGKRKLGISQKIIRENNLDAITEENENLDEFKINESNGKVADEKLIKTDDGDISVENEATYRKHLIQEIILGSRGTSTADTCLNKKFIGLVSDEEEILGFVKGSDLLLQDAEANVVVKEETPLIIEQNHQNKDCVSKVECREGISHMVNLDVKIEENRVEPIKEENMGKGELKLNVVTGDVNFEMIKPNISEEGFCDFPKIIPPKQYASKRCKSGNTSAVDQSTNPVINENSKIENLGNSNLNTLNNNAITETIDLPLNTQSDNETLNVEYNVLEGNDVIYSSDSESCSCFDEKSNDSTTSSEANEIVSTESTVSADVLSHNIKTDTYAMVTNIELDVDEQINKMETDTNRPSIKIESSGDEFSTNVEGTITESSTNIINKPSIAIEASINEASTNMQGNTSELLSNVQACIDELLNNTESDADEVLSNVENDADEQLPNSEESLSENNKHLSIEDVKRGTKRKHPMERKEENESEIALRKRCENCVDWDSISCLSCSIKFSNNNELLEHMALHFNWLRYECTQCNFKAYLKSDCKNHRCSDELITNHIMEIPLWRTINMASSFNNIHNACSYSPEINSKHVNNTKEPSLTCNVEKIKTQDPSLRKMIMEVIFGTPDKIATELPVSTMNTRPIRNRVSIQTVQKDFEYDMKQIDSKMRRTTSDCRVKPIKIVKNNDMNFHVVNTNSEELVKRKRTY